MGVVASDGMYDVIVVGAGLAGLQAARTLVQHSPALKILIVEARDAIGGRIKNIAGIAPWPVELGPEFIHGAHHSSIKRLVDEMGCEQRELPFPDRYYFGSGALLSEDEAEKNADVAKVGEMFSNLAEVKEVTPDISVRDYLASSGLEGVSERVMELAESIYANDFGCSLAKLGLRESIHEAQNWIYGDTYFILDRPILSAAEYLARGLEIKLKWVVGRVHYSPQGCQVSSTDGSVLQAKRVIVTVPLTILQRRSIAFDPPLPAEKQHAIDAISMSNAVKVLLAFSKRFWPDSLFDICCAGCFLPEVWITSYPPQTSTGAPPLGPFVMVGFVAGDAATAMAKLPPDEIERRSLQQLDQMFGSRAAHASDEAAKPATCAFVGCHVANWADEPHILGAYSHPSVGAFGQREVLAAPVAGRLFFAGEATHPGVNPCMQAALDTGTRAAFEVQAQSIVSRMWCRWTENAQT